MEFGLVGEIFWIHWGLDALAETIVGCAHTNVQLAVLFCFHYAGRSARPSRIIILILVKAMAGDRGFTSTYVLETVSTSQLRL